MLAGVLVLQGTDSRAEPRAGGVERPYTEAGAPATSSDPIDRPVGPGPEELRRMLRGRDEDRERRKALREGGDRRQDRVASRTRHRRLSGGEAKSLARRHLERTFERPRDPLRRNGVAIEAYLGTNAARVRLDSGQTALVESLLPLRARDESGDLKPVDLTLESVADGFRPVRGGSESRLPKRLRDGVVLGRSGVSIDIASPETDSLGTAEDGGVFYPNAEIDTDVAVVPDITGVEVFHFLRSIDSPEEFVIRYGGGVTLRERTDGGVDVLRGAEQVDQVAPPRAWDADHEPVPMRLRADADRLLVSVEHRGRDVAYPVTADPSTGEAFHWTNFSWSKGETPADDQTGWGLISSRAIRQPIGENCEDTGGAFCFGGYNWFWGPGIYTWMRDNPNTPALGWEQEYRYGDMGEWVFQAPGESYIWRVDMLNLKNEYDSSCSYQGIYSIRSNRWEEQSWWDPAGGQHHPSRTAGEGAPRGVCVGNQTDWLTICSGQWDCREGSVDYGRHTREPANYVVFGTQIFKPRVPSYTNFLGAAYISIGDRDRPRYTDWRTPTGWTNDRRAPIDVRAEDPGLGLRQLRLYAPAADVERDPRVRTGLQRRPPLALRCLARAPRRSR